MVCVPAFQAFKLNAPGSHHEPVELAQFLKLCYSRLRPSQVTPTRHTCAPEQETGWASRVGIMCSQSAHVYNGPVLGVRLCCHHLELLPRFLTKLPYYIGPSKLHSLSLSHESHEVNSTLVCL